jgi:two-component system nitrate/nitrite response regulator NarL
MTRVFIIARAWLYAEGLAGLLARDARLRVVGSANDWPQALERIVGLQQPPDVVLLDLEMPQGMAAVRALTSALAAPHLIALAASEDEDAAMPWAEAGVAGLVSRDASLDDLVRVLEAAGRGEAAWSPPVAAALLHRFARLAQAAPERRSQLTSREREIMALIDRGLSNKEIASELQIELPTVKNHVHHVLNKLNASRRGEAAAMLRGERPLRRRVSSDAGV